MPHDFKDALSRRRDGETGLKGAVRDCAFSWKCRLTLDLDGQSGFQQGHFNLNTGFKVSPQTSLSLEIMRCKRCMGRHKSLSGCWLRKWAAVIKRTRRNSKRKLQKYVLYHFIRPFSLFSGILTPAILCADECFLTLWTLEIEEIGQRTQSMKPTDNEIWLGFFKNKIRPASHLCPRYQPLRI